MNAEADFIQADRILRVETPLGDDVLLAEKLDLREVISGFFEGTLVARSKSRDLAPGDLLGSLVDVSVELGGGERRSWNALVMGMTAGPKATRGLQSYTLMLRPEAWLLTQTSDCRIWLDKSSVDVAEALLGEHGITAPVIGGITSPPPPKHYSVQYNETDWAYLVRRLEEDGIFYWFEHEEGAHRMHIADHASGYTSGNDPDVRFAAGSTDRNHITRFETRLAYTPGVHAGGDWNFETPGQVPGGDAPSLVSLPRNGNYEMYEYPAVSGYGTGTRASEGIADAEVARLSRLRMQAMEMTHKQIDGGSNVRTLAAGRKFTPYDVANQDNVMGEYVTHMIEHAVVDTSYESVENQPEYLNRFVALPSDLPATPGRTVPRPRIDGAQVAIVAGPEGEEIHPDEYGRIKVWFPWDRRASKDGSDTCWLRVMQNWAGGGWGGQVIPRIGMEVMVSYLEGDPDRPVVTGIVPNPRQRVPYDLPINKTRSTFRTNTHKGAGFNELRFEDERGIEEIFMHAQRDRNTIVNFDDSSIVRGNALSKTFGEKVTATNGSSREQIGGSSEMHVMGNMSLNVGPKGHNRRLVEAGRFGDHGYRDGSRRDFNTFKREMRPGLGSGNNGSFQINTQGAFNVDADRDMDLYTAQRFDLNAKEGCELSTEANIHLASERSTSISSGDSVTIRATRELVLMCGQARIVLHSDGRIALDGSFISTVASGTVRTNANGNIEENARARFIITGNDVDIN
ncbi:type VI secretion system tip protein TssI/VgrG [Jannaschia sp. CCS1]|uniref:type VI secretion system tip protein TssI/VgrG n=1 Tax=Jannaschia sp. (strain CCS1) TaxID=290400 RepID=UPI000053A1C8|nr:type VI secretion system tip protein TssI/VgrG [Jannaschia sp. CCS1]ABD55937.1 Rhs element Vgr protein [Jannaschia sp. CCS1]